MILILMRYRCLEVIQRREGRRLDMDRLVGGNGQEKEEEEEERERQKLLRSSSWLATLPVTTRRPESSPVISDSLSGTTRSRTNYLPESPSPRVESCLTSRLSSCPRGVTRPPSKTQ